MPPLNGAKVFQIGQSLGFFISSLSRQRHTYPAQCSQPKGFGSRIPQRARPMSRAFFVSGPEGGVYGGQFNPILCCSVNCLRNQSESMAFSE
jgi:hypothetical protein